MSCKSVELQNFCQCLSRAEAHRYSENNSLYSECVISKKKKPLIQTYLIIQMNKFGGVVSKKKLHLLE